MVPVFARLATSALMNRRGGLRPGVIVLVLISGCLALVGPIVIPAVALMALVSGSGGASIAGLGAIMAGCASTQPANALTASLSVRSDSRAQLNGAQIANARTILAVAQHYKIPVYGRVVALATALQESQLVNLTTAVDHDSLGVFQQRPSAGWGTAAQITDVALSTRAFFGIAEHTHAAGLLQVPGWQQMSVAQAAQAVQRSAFPTLYAAREPLARQLVTELDPTAVGADQCGTGTSMSCAATGLNVEADLTPDARRVLRCLHQYFPRLSQFLGDYAARGDSDHTTGRAVDAMIPAWNTSAGRTLGWHIAKWEQAHAAQLGIKYLIFDQKIWSPQRTSEGWRPYSNPYGDTDAAGRHLNHVHTSVYGNTAGQSDGQVGDVGLPLAPGSYALGAAFGQCGSHWQACHTGQDFKIGTGAPVLAVAAGTVVGDSDGGPYGRLTRVNHGHGVQTWYAHQSRQDVAVGDHVTAGQQIGLSGATGNTTGPHLHLEVRIGGSPVDPVPWLRDHGADPGTVAN